MNSFSLADNDIPVIIGGVMLDKYTYGRVVRLNPEAPVPLFNAERSEYRLGGAANVAANVASLVGRSILIGCIGHDAHGEKFKELCEERNIQFIPIYSDKPTITKCRYIESTYHQQILRVDHEMLPVTGDITILIEYIRSQCPQWVIVSDYAKGLITQTLTQDLFRMVSEYSGHILADVKPKNVRYFQNAYVIKPNLKEFREMA